MNIYNKTLDNKLVWAGVAAVSAALIIGGIAGHSVTAIVMGSLVAGSFGSAKAHQVYKKRRSKNKENFNSFDHPVSIQKLAAKIGKGSDSQYLSQTYAFFTAEPTKGSSSIATYC